MVGVLRFVTMEMGLKSLHPFAVGIQASLPGEPSYYCSGYGHAFLNFKISAIHK